MFHTTTIRIIIIILCLYALSSYLDAAHACTPTPDTQTPTPIVMPNGVVITIPIPPAYIDPILA